ncbi:thioesterase II family protein [Nonomuraea sp. SBT364]|uniref:thioesterase II family protein n=1 Tax=Nonomuraea sp. SBT364 TaxID=1580530 RepID=UPI00066ACCD2|nr:alpha/beta fold hydrolase [Nonomuraea sp. SBT364]
MSPYHGDLWIRRFHEPSPDAPRLVCFPHAGGSASYFVPLSQALLPDLEVLVIQYPGRQDRVSEPCVEDLHALADEIFRRVRKLAGPPPALFGHSMGATLAFEVAQRLEGDGIAVPHLFVSAARGPSSERSEEVHLRDDDGIIAEMRRLNGTDDSLLLDPELMRLVLGPIRSDYKALERYRYAGGVLTCPATALAGEADPGTSLSAARSWRDHTRGTFAFRSFPGGHFYLNDELAGVTQEIRRTLRPGS